MSRRIGPLFVSHGAPTLPLDDLPARDFLAGLGRAIGRPQAIVCASAHWETERPCCTASPAPATIHDFSGFPDALYRLRYPAPGEPALARRIVALLEAAGLPAAADPARGLDHGAWVPLMLMYPLADVPVIQLSLQQPAGPAWHARLGAALAPLCDEGVLVMGSGGAVHNLRRLDWQGGTTADWAAAFQDWLEARIVEDDRPALLDYRARAPGAALAHPRDEHLLPLFVALGAASGAGRPLHRSFALGNLSMAAFQWP